MPQTKNSKDKNPPENKPKTPRFNDVRFINYNLSDEQKAECKGWPLPIADLDNLALRLCEGDYRVSLKYDDYSRAFACFINPNGDKHPHLGWVLTGRGSTPLKALKQACYIHFLLFEEDWSEYQMETKGIEIDD